MSDEIKKPVLKLRDFTASVHEDESKPGTVSMTIKLWDIDKFTLVEENVNLHQVLSVIFQTIKKELGEKFTVVIEP